MKFIKKAFITILATLSMSPFCVLRAVFVNHALKLMAKNKTIFVLQVMEYRVKQGITAQQMAQIAREKKASVFLSNQDTFFQDTFFKDTFFKELANSCKKEEIRCSKLTEFFGNEKINGTYFLVVPAKQYEVMVKALGNGFCQKDSFRSKNSSRKITVKELFLFSGLRLDPDNYKIDHTEKNVAAYLNRHNASQVKKCGVMTKKSVSVPSGVQTCKTKNKLSYLINRRTITSFALGLCLVYAYTTYKHKICTFAKRCWQWLSPSI